MVNKMNHKKEEQMKEFYQQLSGYMGCEIDRYKSFGHCFGSSWFGGGHNDRRQVYNGANVMTGLVTEKIENGMLQSISGTYDTTIEQVEFMEPKYTEDEACRTLRNLLIRDLISIFMFMDIKKKERLQLHLICGFKIIWIDFI